MKVGLVFFVGNFLLECIVRVEFLLNFFVDVVGGNVNGFIIVLCIVEVVVLIGVIVGG